MDKKIKIIILAHNQFPLLQLQLESIDLFAKCEKNDLIIVDNHSEDGLTEWLTSQQGMDYIICDEKVEGYATILNTVINEFVTDEDIMILSPDYFFLPGCMDILMEALYQEEHIGGVYAGYYRSTDKGCIDYLQAVEIAEGESDIFEKNTVIGIPEAGILLKNEMLRTIQCFDDCLVLPKSTVADLTFRGIMNDYQFFEIKKNCFYINGEKQDIYSSMFGLGVDRPRLKTKWDMNYFNVKPNSSLLGMIAEDKSKDIDILEIGCDCGANLLGVKNKYKNARLYGVEINENAAKIASHIAEVQIANIEDKNLQFGNAKFDYIMFGDVLEHLRDPQSTVEYCKSLLKEGGRIIASIPNIMHYSVMKQLLTGDFSYSDVGLLDRTHIHFFTFNEIMRMFSTAKYDVEDITYIMSNETTREDEEFVKQIMEISKGAKEFMYYAFQYLVKARKM